MSCCALLYLRLRLRGFKWPASITVLAVTTRQRQPEWRQRMLPSPLRSKQFETCLQRLTPKLAFRARNSPLPANAPYVAASCSVMQEVNPTLPSGGTH